MISVSAYKKFPQNNAGLTEKLQVSIGRLAKIFNSEYHAFDLTAKIITNFPK